MLRLSVVLLATRAFAQAPDPYEIAKHVEQALGWTDKFETVLAIQIEGTLDGAPIKVLAKQPRLFRMDLTSGKDTIIQAYDGSFGWQKTEGEHPQPVSELVKGPLDQLVDQASNAIGGPLVRARERGTHLDFEGRETVEGKPCYKLKLTLVSGSVIHSYIDPATYQETHEELEGQGSGPVIVESVGDYRAFGGILFPCRFVSHARGETKEYELRIAKITINPPLSPRVFAMPIP